MIGSLLTWWKASWPASRLIKRELEYKASTVNQTTTQIEEATKSKMDLGTKCPSSPKQTTQLHHKMDLGAPVLAPSKMDLGAPVLAPSKMDLEATGGLGLAFPNLDRTTAQPKQTTTTRLTKVKMDQQPGFAAWRVDQRLNVPFKKIGQRGSQGRGWGDANQWDQVARQAGILVDDNPAPGSVAQHDRGPLGHVAWVVGVEGNSVRIEDYNGSGGTK
ncbi:hypothetical protein MY3957_010085, partial [Beauveria namnaoensis]